MAVCDAHGAAWGLGKQKQIKRGQGYLMAATFMRSSVIQEKALDAGAALGFSREDYRREIERVQGEGTWLICDDCLKLLNLRRADKEAARKAAQQWWKDNNTPGCDPDADLIEGAEELPQARTAQPPAAAAPPVFVGKTHCPRCGAENDAARAACWNCFAQLHPPAGAEARRPKPKPVKPERKKEKVAPTPPPVAEPIVPPAPIEAEAAPVETEPAPVEIEQATAEVEESPPPVAPLEIPPIMATVEPIEAEPEGEQVFVAGVPLRELPAPKEEPSPAVETEPAAEPAVPEAEVEEEAPAPGKQKVFDLDEPVTDSAFVIPGLAEREAEPELEPGEEDARPLVDLGGPVLDLDAEEPEEKPDDKKPKDKT